MKNVYVETSLLVDFIVNKAPIAQDINILIDMAKKREVCLYTSAISFVNLYNIISYKDPKGDALALLQKLSRVFEIIEVPKSAIKEALKSDFKDFETAVQSFSLKLYPRIELIVARHTKDFKLSDLPVFTTKQVFTEL